MGDGSERWHRLEPHPQSLGEYSESGTIGDYFEDQDAQGFIDAADAYVEWVHAATEIMNDIAQDGETAAFDAGILDMDEVVTSWCAARNEAPPSDVEARRSLHLKLLYEELDHLKGGRDEQD
ncbi:MAG: hypothetical protein P8J20_10580 [Novosphingobium sp.]|nr:hypothetical protein [Novosphingobium sp.]